MFILNVLIKDAACCDVQAAYHGVPIVCVPHFGDQEMNAVKVISKVNPSLLLDRV